MGCEGVRAQIRHNAGVGEEADAHGQLLHHCGGGHLYQRLDAVQIRLPAVVAGQGQEAVMAAENRAHAQHKAHHHADRRRQGCAVHAHLGEWPDAIDQQIVEDYIDHVGGDVHLHGQLGVAHAALGRTDAHRQRLEGKGTAQDHEIIGGEPQGTAFLRAGKAHQCAAQGQQNSHQHR